METKLIRRVILAMAIATSVGQAATLVYDDFSTAGNINGTTPDVTIGGAQWSAPASSTVFGSNSTALSADTATGGIAGISLGSTTFLSSNAAIYTLSLDVTFPSTSTSTSWIGLGFTQDLNVASSYSSLGTSGGTPWLLYRANGAVNVYAGPGTGNNLFTGNTSSAPNGALHTIKLILNTQAAQWTLNAFIDSTQLDLNGSAAGQTFTFLTNPTIGYVGISTSGGVGGPSALADNFTLTTSAIPEPSVICLSGIALIGLFVLRRSRARA